MARIKKAKTTGTLGDGFVMINVPNPLGNDIVRVVKRMTGDPIGEMHNRRQITEAQKLAADRYSHAYVISSGQSNAAIDYSAVKVDTFGAPDALSVHQLDAMRDLASANKELGFQSVLRVRKVVGEGASIKDYCKAMLGKHDTRTLVAQMNMLRADLTALAILWNYESKARAAA